MPTPDLTHGPSLSWLRRLGLFLAVVAGAGVAGALVEWTVRWVLPAPLAVFLDRVVGITVVLYWMPVILAEEPAWTERRRIRVALVAAAGLAAIALVISS